MVQRCPRARLPVRPQLRTPRAPGPACDRQGRPGCRAGPEVALLAPGLVPSSSEQQGLRRAPPFIFCEMGNSQVRLQPRGELRRDAHSRTPPWPGLVVPGPSRCTCSCYFPLQPHSLPEAPLVPCQGMALCLRELRTAHDSGLPMLQGTEDTLCPCVTLSGQGPQQPS